MSDSEVSSRKEVLERLNHAYAVLGISKQVWLKANPNFSEAQWHKWHNPNESTGTNPSIEQAREIFTNLDISELYVWHGFGPLRISECKRLLKDDEDAVRKYFMEAHDDDQNDQDRLIDQRNKIDQIYAALKMKGWI